MYTQFIPNVYQENSQTGGRGRRGGGGRGKERQHSVKVNTQQISQQKTTH